MGCAGWCSERRCRGMFSRCRSRAVPRLKSTVYLEEFFRSNSLCPACLICHPVSNTFSVWTLSAQAFPISHLLYKLPQTRKAKPSANALCRLSGTSEGKSGTPAESLHGGSALVSACVREFAGVMIPAHLLQFSRGFTHVEHNC